MVVRGLFKWASGLHIQSNQIPHEPGFQTQMSIKAQTLQAVQALAKKWPRSVKRANTQK